MTHSACPECGSAMEDGFIPDRSHAQILQLVWQRGQPEKSTFLGMSSGVKLNLKEAIGVTACRCLRCGFLKLYAKPSSE